MTPLTFEDIQFIRTRTRQIFDQKALGSDQLMDMNRPLTFEETIAVSYLEASVELLINRDMMRESPIDFRAVRTDSDSQEDDYDV